MIASGDDEPSGSCVDSPGGRPSGLADRGLPEGRARADDGPEVAPLDFLGLRQGGIPLGDGQRFGVPSERRDGLGTATSGPSAAAAEAGRGPCEYRREVEPADRLPRRRAGSADRAGGSGRAPRAGPRGERDRPAHPDRVVVLSRRRGTGRRRRRHPAWRRSAPLTAASDPSVRVSSSPSQLTNSWWGCASATRQG